VTTGSGDERKKKLFLALFPLAFFAFSHFSFPFFRFCTFICCSNGFKSRIGLKLATKENISIFIWLDFEITLAKQIKG